MKTLLESIKTNLRESETIDTETHLSEINNEVLGTIYVNHYGVIEMYEYDWTMKDLNEAIKEVGMPIVTDMVRDVLPSAKLTFKEVYNPNYYNYEGDQLIFDLDFDKDEYEALKEKIMNTTDFARVLKDKYRDRPGFMSFFADDVDEFNQQAYWKQVCTIIAIAISNIYSETDRDNLQDQFYYGVEEYIMTHCEYAEEEE